VTFLMWDPHGSARAAFVLPWLSSLALLVGGLVRVPSTRVVEVASQNTSHYDLVYSPV
jgi:hypothetical protein